MENKKVLLLLLLFVFFSYLELEYSMKLDLEQSHFTDENDIKFISNNLSDSILLNVIKWSVKLLNAPR